MITRFRTVPAFSLAALLLTSACATTATTQTAPVSTEMTAAEKASFEKDRQAILAMAGDYKVTFDFIETVSFADGYELKDRKVSGGHEVVRVIADEGDFISLQHILVVGKDKKFPIKHWRQDWVYEPEQVLTFIGGNAWEMKEVPADEREGQWSQAVYQVDDSPRYGAVGEWSHADGTSEWIPPKAWRPLPRRDMTTRDDYHAVDAMNRHAITPFGWVHEQDNSKLVLSGEPRILVREIGVNTYSRDSDFAVEVADNYWAATKDYWANVRRMWNALEEADTPFALTLKGEPEDLYKPLLDYASKVEDGEMSLTEATETAQRVIDKYTTTDLPPLADRLRETVNLDAY